MVVNQVSGHLLSLGIFAHGEVALHEQMHTPFLIYLTYVSHFSLWGHMLNGKLQIMNQHLEDSLLAG